MALQSRMEKGVLVVRSVGDQSMEVGLAQLNAGIDLAVEAYSRTGQPTDMLIDLTESRESKGTTELEQIVIFLAQRCPPLSGRVALVAPEDLLFGLSRIFSARGSNAGLTGHVVREEDEAWEWIRSKELR